MRSASTTCGIPARPCSSPPRVHAKAIQGRLGHSSIQITMDRYGRLLESAYESVSDALDDAYTAGQAEPNNVTDLYPGESLETELRF
jgi:hypothetical protein